jgi:hypothetical protein
MQQALLLPLEQNQSALSALSALRTRNPKGMQNDRGFRCGLFFKKNALKAV